MNSPGGAATKVDLIIDCYSQMRISGLTVDPTPEDLEVALSRLENMASEWFDIRNICAGYNFEDEPDPNSPSNVPRSTWQAFSTNLAMRLMPDFGKQVLPSLMGQASQSLSSLSGKSMLDRLNQVDYPNRMPRGSGNTLRYNRWNRFYREQATAPTECATNKMVVGDVDDFVEHFDSYLNDGETIASFSLVADPALIISNDAISDNDIVYRVSATGATNDSSLRSQQVTIIITTSDGRVETRFIFFALTPS